jgi:hypothetical protein
MVLLPHKGGDEMFIRKTKVGNYEYLMLVESYREQETKKVKQRMLYNFGRTDVIKQDAMFIKIVDKLNEFIQSERSNNAAASTAEGELYNYGYFAYAKLWEDLGISRCLRTIQGKYKTEFSICRTTFLMAIQHLLMPRSKLGTYERQGKYLFHEPAALQHLYRCLDKLADNKANIEERLF